MPGRRESRVGRENWCFCPLSLSRYPLAFPSTPGLVFYLDIPRCVGPVLVRGIFRARVVVCFRFTVPWVSMLCLPAGPFSPAPCCNCGRVVRSYRWHFFFQGYRDLSATFGVAYGWGALLACAVRIGPPWLESEYIRREFGMF